MTADEKAAFIWNKALDDALGCSHPAPFDYADQRLREYNAPPKHYTATVVMRRVRSARRSKKREG